MLSSPALPPLGIWGSVGGPNSPTQCAPLVSHAPLLADASAFSGMAPPRGSLPELLEFPDSHPLEGVVHCTRKSSIGAGCRRLLDFKPSQVLMTTASHAMMLHLPRPQASIPNGSGTFLGQYPGRGFHTHYEDLPEVSVAQLSMQGSSYGQPAGYAAQGLTRSHDRTHVPCSSSTSLRWRAGRTWPVPW